jgi:hypothetical protein
MKTTFISLAMICTAILLSLIGCEKKTEPDSNNESDIPKIGYLKTSDELKPVLLKLDSDVENSPEIKSRIDQILKDYKAISGDEIKGSKLESLYNITRKPGNTQFVKRSLSVFVELGSQEVIREALLYKSDSIVNTADVVIIATEGIIENVKKSKPDEKATPYLISVLKQNNFLQEGSEEASIHSNLKRKLVEAIQRNAGMAVKEINIDDSNQINKFLDSIRKN